MRMTFTGAQPRLKSWEEPRLGAHGQRRWVREGVAPSAVRVRGYHITPGKFMKTQMLNPAFWLLLAVKFLAFWKLRPRSWGTNTLLVPNLKVGD